MESVGHCRLISVGSCHFLRCFDEGVSCYFFLALVSVMGKHLLHMPSSSVQITRGEQGGKLSAPLSAPISHDRRNECNLFA